MKGGIIDLVLVYNFYVFSCFRMELIYDVMFAKNRTKCGLDKHKKSHKDEEKMMNSYVSVANAIKAKKGGCQDYG